MSSNINNVNNNSADASHQDCKEDSDNEPEEGFGHFDASDHISTEGATEEVSSSPGAYSYSSSTEARRCRIVELLQGNSNHETRDQDSEWVIRPEFYAEDVAMDEENMSADDETSLASTDMINAIDGDSYSRDLLDVRMRADNSFNDGNENYDDDDDDDTNEHEHIYDEEIGQEDPLDGDRIQRMLDDAIGEDDDESDADYNEGSDIDDYEDLGHNHIGAQSSTDESDDSDSNEEVNYDIQLPVNHSYLGDNFEEPMGLRQVLVEGSQVQLPLFNLELLLFPGQTMPITSSNLSFHVKTYLKDCLKQGLRLIGIIYRPRDYSIGTTAEIRNFSIEDGELKLILEGGQRFKLIGEPFDSAVREAKVEILPEIVLGHPYPRISSSLAKLSIIRPILSTSQGANSTLKMAPNPCPVISRFPAWVHRHYDARFLKLRILNQIKEWCSINDLASKHPNDFSYWMSSMLPISNRERMEALSLGCAEARLLWLVELLENCKYLACSMCENVICNKKDVFAMSQSGPQCSFVNPGGYIHDTLTVKSTRGLFQEAGWEDLFSWFPGYKWRMAHCSICGRHIGWCYKHIDAKTRPKRFFGLSRANVHLKRPSEPPEPELAIRQQQSERYRVYALRSQDG